MDEHTSSPQAPAEQTNAPVSSPADPRAAGDGAAVVQGLPRTVLPLRPAYPRRRGTGRDLALAAALLAACFLLWDALCWAAGLGLGEALGLLALLPAVLFYLRDRPERMSGFGWVWAALYALGSVSLALSGDGVLKALTLPALSLLLLLVIYARLGLWTGTGLLSRLSDVLAGCSMSWGRMRVGAWALTHTGAEDSQRGKRSRAILTGLLCAVPALLVLVPLLISSDAAFEGMVGALDWSAAGPGLLALGCGGFMALLLFTLLFSSDRGPARRTPGGGKGMEPAAAAAFLGAVSAAYLLYLIAQFAYFTDAFRGLLPKNFTVAQYARRGFFEMCGIVSINLGLIVLALGVVRKEGGRVPGAVKGLSVFLCVFSLGLVATALSKMVLYMGSFGLTRLRVLTSVFMVYLAVVVLAVALRLYAKKLPVLRLAAALGMAVLIALSLANVDGMVARYNVGAWKSGRLDSLDMKTVCSLGDGAVPVIAELAGDSDPEIGAKARDELKLRSVEEDWRSWNLVTAQANAALEKISWQTKIGR